MYLSYIAAFDDLLIPHVNDEERLGRIAAVDTYLNRVVKYVEFRYVGQQFDHVQTDAHTPRPEGPAPSTVACRADTRRLARLNALSSHRALISINLQNALTAHIANELLDAPDRLSFERLPVLDRPR